MHDLNVLFFQFKKKIKKKTQIYWCKIIKAVHFLFIGKVTKSFL